VRSIASDSVEAPSHVALAATPRGPCGGIPRPTREGRRAPRLPTASLRKRGAVGMPRPTREVGRVLGRLCLHASRRYASSPRAPRHGCLWVTLLAGLGGAESLRRRTIWSESHACVTCLANSTGPCPSVAPRALGYSAIFTRPTLPSYSRMPCLSPGMRHRRPT
jgi:hypothetical protein